MDAQKFMESDAHWDWWDSYRELTAKSAELQSGMDAYYQNLMKQMLVSEDENTVCSPINLYIAFAMLAETSDGNTRQQILDMLGAQDMDTLRKKCFFALEKQLCRHACAEKVCWQIRCGWMVRKHTMTQRCSGWRSSTMHRHSEERQDQKKWIRHCRPGRIIIPAGF